MVDRKLYECITIMLILSLAGFAVYMTTVSSAKAQAPAFSLVNEDRHDSPIKAQLEQHVVIQGPVSESQVRAELNRRWQQARQLRNWRHHNSTTNVYLYIYATEEQARAGQALWLGMLAWTSRDAQPRIQIHESRLAALGKPPSDRFGLTESERQQVYRELWAADERAMNEARQRIPDSRWEQQIDLERELQARYTTEVRDRWGLDQDQTRQITVEAMEKGWSP